MACGCSAVPRERLGALLSPAAVLFRCAMGRQAKQAASVAAVGLFFSVYFLKHVFPWLVCINIFADERRTPTFSLLT